MMQQTEVIQICVLNTPQNYYHYTWQSDQTRPVLGARVWVPFRNKRHLGVVVGFESVAKLNYTLKSIDCVIDDKAFIPDELFALCRFIQRYYFSTLPQVLNLALPKFFRLGKQNPKPRKKKIEHHSPDAFSLDGAIHLNEEQRDTLEIIQRSMHHFQPFLLYGVTGSGKTEIYLQLANQLLQTGKQILILVPEIGLTPQMLQRFHIRFQTHIGVIHSHITDTERASIWQQAKENQIQLIIGTRSALFTPMPNLGLIIIDEEHDPSFKQMENVRFSARDMAVIRAQLQNIPILLGSATPSLESYYNAMHGKYQLLKLTQKAQSQIPTYFQLVDTRCCQLEEGLAPQTIQAIQQTLEKNLQVLVYINRRGFSPILMCQSCQGIVDCTACNSHLTFHQTQNRLICHHCGRNQRPPTSCSQCCTANSFIPVGAGTQRIQQTLARHFPLHRLVRMDRDEIKTLKAWHQHLENIHLGQTHLMIGTQMLAKGHHFPNLGLVVILDADLGFFHPDFHALEQLGQMIVQVSGRTGRSKHAGQVIIQTQVPQHPHLNLLIQQGYEAFIQALLPERQIAHWPPFSYLALLRAHGKKSEDVLQFLKHIKDNISHAEVQLMGPAPALLNKKDHQYHFQLLFKAKQRKSLHLALTKVYHQLSTHPSKSIRWSLDVHPIDLS